MRKVIRRRIRRRAEGLDLAVDVNAVIAVNRDGGDDAEANSVQRTTVVQGGAASAAADGPQGAEPAPDEPRDTTQEER
jgi:hypothetical protein